MRWPTPKSPTSNAAVAVLAVSLAATLAVSLAGCGSEATPSDAASPVAAAPTASLTPGAGFAPATPPPPAGTFTPSPGSWTGSDPAAGYPVVLLTTEQDRRTRVLADAVRSWADEVGADLTVVTADDPGDYVTRIQQAADLDADLVVTTGEGLVDPLALVTASNLDQPFLVLGAELAEPTLNVTAADWAGASYRGEGLGQATTFDPASFTPERAGRALRAGVAAVLTGLNGTVVWVA